MLSRGLCAFVFAAGLAVQASGQIQWRSAPPLDLRAQAAAQPQDMPGTLTRLAGPGQARRVVVQLTGAITDDGRAALSNAGVTLLAPLGGEAFFATLDGTALAGGAVAAAGNALPQWILAAAPVDPVWKLDPRIVRGDDLSSWAVISTRSAEDPSVSDKNPIIAVYVRLHNDVLTDNAAAATVRAHGGQIISPLATFPMYVVHIPRDSTFALANEDIVQWIEVAMPRMSDMNSENRQTTGANIVQAAPYNLSGALVDVFVFDGGGVFGGHTDLTPRVTVLDGSAAAAHATHVAGTIGGTGAQTAANQGMAPGVRKYLSASINLYCIAAWLHPCPSDLEADDSSAWNNGVDIANNSIGTNASTNGFDCTWWGNYGATSGLIDAIVRGDSVATANTPFRICWAAGNERQSSRCIGVGNTFTTNDFGSLAPPAGNKNAMVIGAVNSASAANPSTEDTITSFSSFGPSEDGRLRPDFC